MIAFLKIVLAVFVVIALLALAAWLWLRRRFKRAVGDFSVASDMLQTLQLEPARVQLHRNDHSEYSYDVVTMQNHLKRLGFQRMASLADYAGALQLLVATRHRELPVAAAVVEDMSGRVFFTLISIDSDRRVVGRGNGPGGSFSAAKIDWQIAAELSPEAAFEDIRNRLSSASLPFDLRLFRAVYEQVYAVRMDQRIVHRPEREFVARLAAAQPEPATEEQIDAAYEMLLENWNTQIEEAVLDRYRRSSKIDAVAWEEQRDDIQVVHAHIDHDDVANLLVVDDVSEQIYEQCRAQGLSGIALYQAVAQRLPPDQQWTQIGAVDRPIPALLFRPNEDIDSDVRSVRPYVYEAEGDEGGTVQGRVFAHSGADAKRQTANLGLRNSRLLMEPGASPDEFDDAVIDDRSAAAAARSMREGILKSILRALAGNWWIWAPPAALMTKTYIDGPPHGWGDYVGWAWAALALTALVFLICPMVFYNQLLLAQLNAQPARARFWIRLLGVTGRFVGPGRSQLTTERCKALAEEGRLEEALELQSADREDLTEEGYQAALTAIYGAAGEWPSMIAAQRAFLAATPAQETATIDLAMSLARYTDDVESAEALIQSVAPGDLPEMAMLGYQYVRGLVAAHRGQHQQALRHYAQAIETARQFETLPIMAGLIAEINGYAALATKRTGDLARANDLWEQVWPILRLHRSSARLIAEYESS